MMPFINVDEYSSGTGAGGSRGAGDRETGRRRAAQGARLTAGGANLAADLPARRQVRVHVRVGGAGPDGGDHLGELTSRELLARGAPGHDAGGRDRPGAPGPGKGLPVTP